MLHRNEVDAFFEHLEAGAIDGLRDMQRTCLIEGLESNAAPSCQIQIRRDSARRSVKLRAHRGNDDMVTLQFTTQCERFADELDAMVRLYFGEDGPQTPDLTT